MRIENHLQTNAVLPFDSCYAVKPVDSCYPAFRVVRPILDVVEQKNCCRKLPNLVAAAIADERKMIGQELHDNVNQLLTTVKLFVEMLKPESVREKDIRKKTIEYIAMAIDDIREISGELVKNKKSSKGLVQAIALIVEDIRLATSIGISFRHTGTLDAVDEIKKTTVLRIVQEQLNNVIKYSQATEVTVCLSLEQDRMQVSITDNGIGFDACSKRSGIGLTNIYDRVATCQGTVELQTAKGKGCFLSVSLPTT